MKEFTPVTRYVCSHCKEDFRTTTRHDCKRDPEKKNCFTCKHNNGWDREDVESGYGEQGYHTYPVWYVECGKDHERTAPDLSRVGYKLNCPDWEQKEEGQ